MGERLNILNIWVDAIDRDRALEKVRGFLQSEVGPHVIFASNPEKNFSLPKDPELHEVYRNADLLLPDGTGMVLAASTLYGVRIERIPGVDFFYDLCRLARDQGRGIFIYGAREEVNQKAVDKLIELYPGIRIAGRSNGYVMPDQMDGLIDQINASGAEILFIALGSPKQEKWYESYKDTLQHVKVCQGIGGTLDTIAGTVKRAPDFWCRHSLEWFYRLIAEPKRAKRQRVLPIFVVEILFEKLKWLIVKRPAVS